MKASFAILTSLVLCGSCVADPQADPVTFPAKPGEYTHKGWKYVYMVQLKGTRSEKRIGRLFLNGEEIKGKIGELHQDAIGVFIYFGEAGYNQGWLNTLTYDQAVFAEDGSPTAKVASLLRALRDKKINAGGDDGREPATGYEPE